MSTQWKNTDNANSSVLWAPDEFKQKANTTTRNAMFGNTTANAVIPGMTVGQYGVSPNEMKAVRADHIARPAHAGWAIKKTGQGGRAGRVQYETLVAMGSITGDAENVSFPNTAIQIVTQPLSGTYHSSNNQVATFTVGVTTVPANSAVTYQWQVWSNSAFANLASAGAYSNVTTSTLSVLANTAANGEIYRVQVANASALPVYSTNAAITIVV